MLTHIHTYTHTCCVHFVPPHRLFCRQAGEGHEGGHPRALPLLPPPLACGARGEQQRCVSHRQGRPPFTARREPMGGECLCQIMQRAGARELLAYNSRFFYGAKVGRECLYEGARCLC